LPDLLFVKGPNLVQEPNSRTRGQERANDFFKLYQPLQSHLNSYLATFLMAMVLNYNISTAKQVRYMIKDGNRTT